MTAPEPTLQDPKTFPAYRGKTDPRGYSGPGYAEIKPHSVTEIRKGLGQLYREKQARSRRPKPGTPFLVTYSYLRPRTVAGRVKFTIYVLEPNAAALVADPPGPGRGGNTATWLNGLGQWWLVHRDIEGTEHTLADWRTRVHGTVFGSMAEAFVRDAFLARFGKPERHMSKFKGPTTAGPDIDWYEMSGFLYELASELSDVSARR
jgi:hypothetical protein